MRNSEGKLHLTIGHVAAQAGVSSSVIRSWEHLGLIHPQRSPGKYRLYTREDVGVLKRAGFLRKKRGLNAPAIVELLKQEGRALAKPNGAGAIALRLRKLRLAKKLSLAQVAKKVGISVGFLSAIERSQMAASVSTLQKLASFYKVHVLDFYDQAQAHTPLVRPKKRKVLEAGPGVRMELLAWGNTVMEPHLFRIKPRAGSGESYAHAGEEFLYVLRGELLISLRDVEYHLRRSDSFYFESATEHRWSNPGRTETWILWINTPPTF